MQADTIRAIVWNTDHVAILDQTRLPGHEEYLRCTRLEEIAAAIERLSIRGAPAIGIAAAMALALESQKLIAEDTTGFLRALQPLYRRLISTRPTAVNLRWALDRMMRRAALHEADDIPTIRNALVNEARALLAADVQSNKAMGAYGQELIPAAAAIMTICNTGSLATGGHGTALGVIRTAVQQGKQLQVIACETRPLLQGARLTAWELSRDAIACTLITDGMAAFYMQQKKVDLVITGADRIAGNGDTANKIGTYSLAVLAHAHTLPFYVAAPLSTFDPLIADGGQIPIEERSSAEITHFAGIPAAPPRTPVWNPSFDIVPHRYIHAFITDRGVLRPPFQESIRAARAAEESSHNSSHG